MANLFYTVSGLPYLGIPDPEGYQYMIGDFNYEVVKERVMDSIKFLSTTYDLLVTAGGTQSCVDQCVEYDTYQLKHKSTGEIVPLDPLLGVDKGVLTMVGNGVVAIGYANHDADHVCNPIMLECLGNAIYDCPVFNECLIQNNASGIVETIAFIDHWA